LAWIKLTQSGAFECILVDKANYNNIKNFQIPLSFFKKLLSITDELEVITPAI